MRCAPAWRHRVQELIARAKAKPGEVSYGTPGIGGSSHLAGAMLENFTGTKMLSVPFKGNGPALAEVIAGRVTFMFYPVVGIADQVAAGRLKVLAIGTTEPRADFPGAPTTAQAGLPGFEQTAPMILRNIRTLGLDPRPRTSPRSPLSAVPRSAASIRSA